MRRQTLMVAILATILTLLIGACGGGGVTIDGGTTSTEPEVSVDIDGQRKTLPIVDGGDSANPVVANQANTDPRTPVVQDGVATNTWGELDSLLGGNAEYTGCVNNTIGPQWPENVPKFKATEAENYETRFLLVSNSSVTDERARELATQAGVPGAKDLQVHRVPDGFGLLNTRGFADGRPGCQEFLDARPQVRVTLGVVKYDDAGIPAGLLDDRGVMVDCHNPWRLARLVNASTTTAPPTTTTTLPTGGCEVGCVPATTPPPPTCPLGSTRPECLDAKNKGGGAGSQSNVPPPVMGTAPPATSETRPADPPPTYTPPVQQQPPPTTTRTSVPSPPPSPEPPPWDPCNPATPACG